MQVETRELKTRADNLIQEVSTQSCDMGRLGFEYYDNTFTYENGFYFVTLFFRKGVDK